MLQTTKESDNEVVVSEINDIDYRMVFFTTSVIKLVVMSLCTVGIYELYWFYKNWAVIKKAGKDCSPFWRAFFAPISAYSCFWYIREAMVKNKVNEEFPIVFLSLSYFVLHLMWQFQSVGMLLGFLSVLPVLGANQAAVAVNQAQFPEFISNNKFSKWNWLAIILGGLFVLLGIVGLFISDSSFSS